ncbi:Soluble starch synthase 3 [Artemisia annua]|uniref:Soluble starch synthase 3 n=1 Tax=Artemisia annua TaxID=35608 RepID=A0A2U1MYZ6_ARTAN|nr:Soluble starch synthase 3 [Artemisia annua]
MFLDIGIDNFEAMSSSPGSIIDQLERHNVENPKLEPIIELQHVVKDNNRMEYGSELETNPMNYFLRCGTSRAFVLNSVLEDGPPEFDILYDSNRCNDFHAILATFMPQHLYWDKEEHEMCMKLNVEAHGADAKAQYGLLYVSRI